MNTRPIIVYALFLSLAIGCASRPTQTKSVAMSALPFAGDWVETRVSEASTVFFPEDQRGNRRLLSIFEDPQTGQWRVVSAPENVRQSETWIVSRMSAAPNGHTLSLVPAPGAAPTAQLTLYPFWDIPGTVVAIWKRPESMENPVTFLRPAVEMESIPFLPE